MKAAAVVEPDEQVLPVGIGLDQPTTDQLDPGQPRIAQLGAFDGAAAKGVIDAIRESAQRVALGHGPIVRRPAAVRSESGVGRPVRSPR